MTPAQFIRKYAKITKVSVRSMEVSMGWPIDTIRKLNYATDKTIMRIREIAVVYPDLYDKVPELRALVGDDLRRQVRDTRIEGMQALIAQQKETIESLKAQIELLNQLLNKYKQ